MVAVMDEMTLVMRPSQAAEQATAQNSVQIPVPGLGTLRLPPPSQLGYLAGIGALVALEIIEWPLGVALACGHLMADCSHNKVLRDFGKALEEA